MAHIYKVTEWQSPTGYWHCNDTSDLAGIAGLWWVPARVLGVSPAEYIEILVRDFKPDNISFNNILLFSWKNQSDMRKYKNWINKIARDKNFIV